MTFNDLLSKGYEIRKTKTWTDEKGRTHKKSVGGWYGNPLLDAMPYLIGVFILLIFLITDPLSLFFIVPVVGVCMIGFLIFSVVYDYKMKHVWTEENGWKTTSLPKASGNTKRLYHGEYNGYKLIRELRGNEWVFFAHNVCTGTHIEYPEKINDEDFSVHQMNLVLDWLKKQINNGGANE